MLVGIYRKCHNIPILAHVVHKLKASVTYSQGQFKGGSPGDVGEATEGLKN